MAPNVVDPYHVSALPAVGDEVAEWSIDRDRGTVALLSPGTALGRLTLPLAPMLGCFGVAPQLGQAISTATSGEHGGNMDYRGVATGVTVYFPVFARGALLQRLRSRVHDGLQGF